MSHRIPKAIADAVKERSAGVCEACRLYGAEHLHHRKKLSQGGKDTVENLIHVHLICHERIHANRGGDSYDRGLLVYRAHDPAAVLVEPWQFDVSGVAS